MKNILKENSGITLIALVITIIVLIILAGVSINILLGQNGIITRARQAAEQTASAEKEEKAFINDLEYYIDEVLSGEELDGYEKSTVDIQSSTAPIDFTITTDIYKLNKRSNKWAILVHGLEGSKDYIPSEAINYYLDNGYNLLCPEMRFAGPLADNITNNTCGWFERLDLLDCIDYIIQQNSNAQIVLQGFSEGAATVSMVSGETLPSNVKAIIADSPYKSMKTVIEEAADTNIEYLQSMVYAATNETITDKELLVSTVINMLTQQYASMGIDFEKISAIDQVKKATVPLLFMHGTGDTIINYTHSQELYNAATNTTKKDILLQEGYEHVRAYVTTEYWEKVTEFLDGLI